MEQHGATESPHQSPAVPEPGKKHLVFGGVGLVIGLAVGAIAGQLAAGGAAAGPTAAAPSSLTTSMTDAVASCGVEDSTGIDLMDEGTSLHLSTAGEEEVGASYVDVLCVLEGLDVPESVVSRFGSTRALDGQQTATWNGLSASWGYHPDTGLDIVVETRPQD